VKDESRGGDQGFVEAHMTTKAKGAAALDIAAIAASMAATAGPAWGFAGREWPEKNLKNNPRRMGAPCDHPNAGAGAPEPAPRTTVGPDHDDALAVVRADSDCGGAARAIFAEQPHQKGDASAIALFLVLPPPSRRWAKTVCAKREDVLAVARAGGCGGCTAQNSKNNPRQWFELHPQPPLPGAAGSGALRFAATGGGAITHAKERVGAVTQAGASQSHLEISPGACNIS
jgi:hypothetical protein